jgi:hypothetical protein
MRAHGDRARAQVGAEASRAGDERLGLDRSPAQVASRAPVARGPAPAASRSAAEVSAATAARRSTPSAVGTGGRPSSSRTTAPSWSLPERTGASAT